MNPEAQRIAIAEARGAKWSQSHDGTIYLSFGQRGRTMQGEPPDCSNSCYLDVPDYLSDLNSIHSVLLTLTEPEQRTCLSWIRVIVNSRREPDYVSASFAALRASAAEWCEAFLRTKGLWKETNS